MMQQSSIEMHRCGPGMSLFELNLVSHRPELTPYLGLGVASSESLPGDAMPFLEGWRGEKVHWYPVAQRNLCVDVHSKLQLSFLGVPCHLRPNICVF